MQIIVDKLLTSYSVKGNGKKVLLFLHGWADTGKTFDLLADQVLKENKGYKVVVLDLPGFGGTQAPGEVWGLSEYAKFVAEFLKKIKYTPTVIVGHSNGGAIAICGLGNEILTADKLVLIASAGIRRPSVKKGALRMLAKPAKMAIKVAPKSAQRKVRHKLYTAIGSDYLIAEHMQETFKKVVATDVVSDAAKLTQPTCLIYGSADTATPPAYGKTLHTAIHDSQLHILPEAGHFVHQEQVYKVAAFMKDFLA